MLRAVQRRARQIGGRAVVMTFRRHPRNVLGDRANVRVLTSLDHKMALLAEAGVRLVLVSDFTKQFSAINPEQFLTKILKERLGVTEFCLGPGARFGHGRRGSARMIRRCKSGGKPNFFEVDAVHMSGMAVSSTRIRNLIEAGRLELAGRLLGRSYSFWGDVVRGKGRGRKMGYPTVNLKPRSEVMPPEGIYTAWIRAVSGRRISRAARPGEYAMRYRYGKFYPALLSFGKRPTFETRGKTVPEVFILDYHTVFAARTAEVVIGKYLRAEKKYSAPERLIRQIEIDVKMARQWFKHNRMEEICR